jgi:beta-lactamase class D
MGIVSIRFNEKEEKILTYLSDHFEEDRSSLIKHSLIELYEDIIDRNTVDKFEEKEKKMGKINFVSSDKIRKNIQ